MQYSKSLLIFSTFKNYIFKSGKRKKELEFQKQWKGYKWKYILACLEEYWEQYRYFDDIMKIIQPKGKRILDVGCGVVSVLNIICDYNGEYYGIDPLMDEYKNLFPLDSRINWIRSIGEEIPFDNSYFDIVICSNVLDHVENPMLVIQEISRVLKPYSKLLLTVDIFDTKVTRDEAHPYCFIEEEISNMLNNNFIILFSKRSTLNAQVMSYAKKETKASNNTQEIIIIGEKKG